MSSDERHNRDTHETADALAGQVLVITGGAAGIGLQTALHAWRAGARVVVVDRVALPSELSMALEQGAGFYIQTDLAESDAADLAAECERPFGAPSIVVNNAAHMKRGSFSNATAGSLQQVLSVNLFAPILLSQALLKLHQNKGATEAFVIVNISSTNALGGAADQFEYSISKAALNAFTKNVSNAHPPSEVRINSLNVAWTLTENEIDRKIADGYAPGWHENEASLGLPLGRLLRPDEVAKHVIFWASPSSAPVTGAIYEIAQNGR